MSARSALAAETALRARGCSVQRLSAATREGLPELLVAIIRALEAADAEAAQRAAGVEA